MANAEPVLVPRVRVLIAAGLFALALLLRLFGIGWGLPDDQHNQSFHPDEYLIWSQAQRIEPAKGQFTPGFYNYGTLYLTMLKVAGDATAAYTGGPKENDRASYWAFIGRSTLAGRILSALAGAGTAVVVFFMLLRFTTLWGAIGGALLPAVAPGFVVHSHFQTVDVLATFFLAVSMLYAIKVVYPGAEGEGAGGRVPGAAEEQTDPMDLASEGPGPSTLHPAPPWREAILCGVFAGLSAGTKYTGILALLALYVALAISERPKKLQLAVAGTAAAFLVFVIATPGILLDSAAFYRDFKYEMAHTSSGHGLLFEGTGSGFVYHLANLQTGLGILLTVVSLAGLFFGFGRAPWRVYFETWRKETGRPFVMRHLVSKWEGTKTLAKENQWALVLLSFWVPYYILIGRAEVKFLRYTFPLYIGLAAGLGYVVAEARRRGGWGHVVVAVCILALAGLDNGGLRKSLQLDATMSARDAREVAVDALRKLDAEKPGLTVGFANDPWYYSPPTFADTGLFRAAPFLQAMYVEMQESAKPKTLWYVPPEVLADAHWDQAKIDSRPRWDVRLLTDLKPDYVAISNFESFDVDRLVGGTDISDSARSEVAQANAFRGMLKAKYQPFQSFGEEGDTVNDMMYVEPVVYVWKRKDLP